VSACFLTIDKLKLFFIGKKITMTFFQAENN